MAYICPVCNQSFGRFMRIPLKDGVVCSSCFVKAGLIGAFDSRTVEVREVVAMCDMSEDEKRQHIEKKREQARQQYEATKARWESATDCRPTPSAPRCPKCGSTSITANQKGFGIGKAVVGAALVGPIGLVAGNLGAKKVFITCLNFGYRWQAGKK